MVGLKKTNNENPGVVRIVAKSRTSEVTLSVNVARQTDAAIVIPRPYIPVSSSVSSEDTATTSSSQSTNNNVPLSLLEQRKKLFSLPTVSITTKITLPTSADDAPKMMQQNMHVLLYNATTQSSSWTLTCSGACSLSDVPFTRVTIAFT